MLGRVSAESRRIKVVSVVSLVLSKHSVQMSSRTSGSSFMSEVTSVLLVMTCEYLREVEQRRACVGGVDRGLCFEEVLRFVGVFQEVVFSGMSAGRNGELLWICFV